MERGRKRKERGRKRKRERERERERKIERGLRTQEREGGNKREK